MTRRRGNGVPNVGRHEPVEYDAEAFAAEAIGTARNMTARWYDREIAWRERLIKQYSAEVKTLQSQRAEFTSPSADTGENPVPGNATGPNATQEFEAPERDPEEPGE